MSDIPYLPPGNTPLDASHMDAIAREANARLVKAFNGQPLFLATPYPFALLCWKKFFLCDDIAPAPTSIANVAIAAYPDSETDPAGVGGTRYWKRAYDHTPFTWAATYATIDSGGAVPFYDPDAPVVRVVPLDDTDWATQKAIIWPDNGSVAETSPSLLEYSLEAHKKIGGDYDGYYLFLKTNANAEYEHWWEQVEIIIGEGVASPYAWPAEWTKYRLFRFHNLLPTDFEIQFPTFNNDGDSTGSTSITVPAMSSLCVRRVNLLPAQGWIKGYDYFQKPLPLDPRFGHGQKFNNLTNPFSIAEMLFNVLGETATPYAYFDLRGLWNPGIIYSGVQAQKTGFPYFRAPAGGYFASITDDTLLGDLCVHKGKLLCVAPAGPFTVTRPSPQVAAVAAPSTVVTLRKEDDSIALGVEDLTVTRVSDSADIADGGGSNWTLTDEGDHFELELVTGDDLADGDEVELNFKHLTDDQKFSFDFKGFSTLAEQCALVGITVTDPDPDHANQILLSSEDDKDLIGLSTNLVLGSFGSPAITVYGGGASIPALSTGMSHQAVKATATLGTLSAIYKTAKNANLSTWFIEYDADITVDCDSTSYVIDTATALAGFSLSDTVGDLLAAINGTDFGDMTMSASVVWTPFGPQVRYEKTLSMLYPVSLAWLSVLESYPAMEIVGTDLTVWNHDLLQIGDGELWPSKAFPRAHYPRLERLSTNIRSHDETVNVMGVMQPTGERPNLKSYYENKPYLDGQTVAQYVGDGPGGIIIKTGIAMLSQWTDAAFDVFARLSAWVNFRLLKYYTSGGDLWAEDFTKTGTAQAAYYSANRSTLLAPLTGNSDDAKIGINGLPMLVEHYNTLASAVNGYRLRPTGDLITTAQTALLANLESRIGSGLGTRNYRPRTQFVAWNADVEIDGTPLSDIVAAFGFTVLDASDFPAPWSDFITGKVSWFNPPSTITNDLGSGTTPLIDHWGPYHGFTADDVTKYRWIAIEDAQAVYASLGLRFKMEELLCPATLKISVGTPSLILSGASATYPITGTFQPINISAVQWYNDPDGDWVYTPENDVIRADVSRIDEGCQAASNLDGTTAYGIYGQGLDADICTRLYYASGIRVNPTQAIVANRDFIYRKYGGENAKAIVWPRNYLDYDREALTATAALARLALDAGLFNYTQRIAVDDLEGGDPEITDLTADETAFTTAFENGKLLILKVGVLLESA